MSRRGNQAPTTQLQPARFRQSGNSNKCLAVRDKQIPETIVVRKTGLLNEALDLIGSRWTKQLHPQLHVRPTGRKLRGCHESSTALVNEFYNHHNRGISAGKGLYFGSEYHSTS